MINLKEFETRKHYRHRLSDEVAEYIREYAILHELPLQSASEAVERIVREHKQNSKNNFRLDHIVDGVTREVTNSVDALLKNSIAKEITKVRLGTNNADRNTQILIELLQGSMQNQNIEQVITTKDYKPEFMNEVEELIQERITKKKQKKDTTN